MLQRRHVKEGEDIWLAGDRVRFAIIVVKGLVKFEKLVPQVSDGGEVGGGEARLSRFISFQSIGLERHEELQVDSAYDPGLI